MDSIDSFVIYLDRLRDERAETIDFQVDADEIQIAEEQLRADGQVTLKGKAYLANDHLVLDLSIKAVLLLPCKICTEMRPFPVEIEHTIITRDLDGIKGAKYNFFNDVREAIMLEIPTIFECNGGHCSQRDALQKYLSTKEN